MALTLRTNGSGSSNIISSGWFNDFYNLFTGGMTDQPITFKYTPGAAGNLLTLTPNANSTPLLILKSDGSTTGVKFDNAANMSQASGGRINLGGKTGTTSAASFLSGGSVFASEALTEFHSFGQGLSISSDTVMAVGFNSYNDGTADRFVLATSAFQMQLNAISSAILAVKANANTPAVGAAITWTAWFPIAQIRASGGTVSANIWVGTTDPGSSAIEGDIWIKA